MLTAAEIAAFLGVSPGRVWQVVVAHRIRPVGKRGRAHLFDADTILRHTGVHDRLAQAADLH